MNEPLPVATKKNRRDPAWRGRHGFDNVAGPSWETPRMMQYQGDAAIDLIAQASEKTVRAWIGIGE